MSIIETLLAKKHADGTQAEPAASENRALQRAPPGSSQRRPPREAFTLNFGRLRAEGMLPPEEFAEASKQQFRSIKWPLIEYIRASNSDNTTTLANLILITSSIPGEGKTFTSLNLALSIARERDFSVLLVDADSAKRHVTKLLGLEEHRGFADLIEEDGYPDPEEAVLGTGIPGLSVLPAGHRSDLGAELFASERTSQLVTQLGANDPRRILLFDAAPVLVTTEPQVLSRIVGQVVLVVRAESTTQPTVLDAVRLLEPVRRIRCILNLAPLSNHAEYYYGEPARPRAGTREHARGEG
jgi:protein-tyrosine kinase